MPSKYTGYLHFSQKDMDKLAEFEPEINNSTMNEVLQIIFDNIIKGKYANRNEDARMQELRMKKLAKECDKLDIQNKLALIREFNLAPSVVHDAIKNEKPIAQLIGDLNDKPIASVNDDAFPYDPRQDKTDGINVTARFECTDCGVLFEFPKTDNFKMESSMMDYFRHIQSRHDRILTKNERDSFTSLGLKI